MFADFFLVDFGVCQIYRNVIPYADFVSVYGSIQLIVATIIEKHFCGGFFFKGQEKGLMRSFKFECFFSDLSYEIKLI